MMESNNQSNKVKIRKVPIDVVMRILGNLYDDGVDFVDFHGIIGEDEDTLGISFSKDYMDPELAQQFEDMEEDDMSEEQIKVKLSDDDIDKLI